MNMYGATVSRYLKPQFWTQQAADPKWAPISTVTAQSQHSHSTVTASSGSQVGPDQRPVSLGTKEGTPHGMCSVVQSAMNVCV